MPTHQVKLKRSRGPSGMAVSGLWESDSVRMEAVEGGWQCEVPMREIGSEIDVRTGIYEFRHIQSGGRWIRIGTYRTRNGGCVASEFLKSGEYVWRSGYSDQDGPVPSSMVRWVDVSDYIRERTSI
jgi:hypothetical protein